MMLDHKTGDKVDLLFAMRACPVANAYINGTVIPTLCHKACPTPTCVETEWTTADVLAHPAHRTDGAGRRHRGPGRAGHP
jgi:hypothetical protein